MMTMDRHLADASADSGAGQLSLASLRSRVSLWVKTCADYYDAATTYERLSHLSNAELRRRGLSRETLARAVVDACERDNRG